MNSGLTINVAITDQKLVLFLQESKYQRINLK